MRILTSSEKAACGDRRVCLMPLSVLSAQALNAVQSVSVLPELLQKEAAC